VSLTILSVEPLYPVPVSVLARLCCSMAVQVPSKLDVKLLIYTGHVPKANNVCLSAWNISANYDMMLSTNWLLTSWFSKPASEFYDPCQDFADRSLKCLKRNNFDREMCGDYFQYVHPTFPSKKDSAW